ncbi:MAG: methyltransferase domain-containing protein [Phenylobacterium sp.]|uniref:class I SAM-dependent methyltransferase n=1 Tax=Phenylobacterium sp. TaxID=1871053 RepID=UPI002728E75A|nr:methyltransferase domain-containing protein [Phenylobacterium sp.]MDO8411045.1 methyltransferase domain-containing protein [Phenylobacterium sp.]
MSRVAAAASMMVAAWLGGCSIGARPEPEERAKANSAGEASLAAVVAGSWRSEAERAEDARRRPEQTLRFLGLGPGETVVEVWPGAGWCTQILAPYLARTGGRYYAAHPSVVTTGPEGKELVARFRSDVAARPDLYGRVREGDFGDGGGRLGLGPESADLVLFPERLHYWMAAGLAEAAFAEAYEALRPGGRLGVIQDRAPSSGAQDPIARDGRVQQAFVVALAGEAGFVLDAAPLIHPRAGQAEGGYERMVLRFRKPMTRGAVLSAQPNVAAPGASL